MNFIIATILSALCILCDLNRLDGANILVVFQGPSYSHGIPFRPLWRELHKRGHELTIITGFPMPDMMNATNFKQIDIWQTFNGIEKISYINRRLRKETWLDLLHDKMLDAGAFIAEQIFKNNEVMELYAPDSNKTFDLVFVEMFHMPSLYGLAHRFDAPIIGISSFGLPSFENYGIGGLILPSHDSNWEMEAAVGVNLSFWQRLENFCRLWYFIYTLYRNIIPRQQQLAERYLGKSVPPIRDIMRNISLVFVNEDIIMSYARPQLPSMINFNSIHVSSHMEPLPEDLKKFVDSATEGFIYFCMGTNAQFQDAPEEIQRTFFDVFAKLPYKIVMKTEKLLIPTPDNVFIRSWFPQQSILAHPNIKLYMYQGGLQSTQEAIHFAVPVLGFPILSDQEFQLKKVQAQGIGNRLAIETLTREELESTIRETITDKKYKRNMIKLRKLIRDRPYDQMQNLVWWTEYMIRNRGAPHLRTNLAWEPWYRYYDMDMIAFLAVAAFVIFCASLWIFVKLLLFTCRLLQPTAVDRKKKTI